MSICYYKAISCKKKSSRLKTSSSKQNSFKVRKDLESRYQISLLVSRVHSFSHCKSITPFLEKQQSAYTNVRTERSFKIEGINARKRSETRTRRSGGYARGIKSRRKPLVRDQWCLLLFLNHPWNHSWNHLLCITRVHLSCRTNHQMYFVIGVGQSSLLILCKTLKQLHSFHVKN